MKIVFITGGVVSSLGKGITASSLGRLLEDGGITVGMMKCDPYLNIDPGTLSPIEHGEVFVTVDGGETDLDLGHYERFLNKDLTKESSLTSGKIYEEVLKREREGYYKGKTVQVVPHVTDLIKEKIYNLASKYELLIVEVGGSVGDIESLSYTEAIRQIKFELQNDVAIIHVGYVPYIAVSGEMKTKPMQRSVNLLRSLGVNADFLVTRSIKSLSDREMSKIAMFASVAVDKIFQAIDSSSIYNIPLKLKKQFFEKKVSSFLGLHLKENNNDELVEFNKKLENLTSEVKIAIVGKYTENIDSYLSVVEALKHAAIANKIKVNYDFINAREDYNVNILDIYDGILVPGGFGISGVDGKIKAIKYARENNVPFLGICFGMQLAIVEFANNVLNLNVVHGELDKKSNSKIIDIMAETKNKILGGTMRLGNFDCEIKKETLASKIYDKNVIQERHRHRYEFNNKFKEDLENGGMIISGIHPKTGLAEIIEIPNNYFFIASQFHPELSSKITNPNSLFVGFIKATNKNRI